MQSTANPRLLLRPLVVGLLTGPVVWSVYHIAAYLLVELACKTGVITGQVAGRAIISWVVLGLTLVSIAVLVWASVASVREYRRRDTEIRETDDPSRAETAARFMTLAGIMLNPLFALLILLAGIPALFLPPCLGL